MAHRSSAFKHIRADKRKRDVSFRRKSAVRTIVKKTKVAIETGNVEEAESLFRRATSLLDRAVSKGVIKKGTANRRKSRLAKSLHLASTH
ncbi:30S ribosomal protein S20 [Candidatus Poribacteria bacterium]|nr:30S ribosomal protein S20 [Candidatus Poribacteria bacterium]